MPLRRRTLVWILVGLALVAGGVLAWTQFAPAPSQQRDEAAPEGATMVAAGTFRDGDPLHHASGNVTLLKGDRGFVLRFEGYEATPGPDVFFYLTREAGASTTRAVEGEGAKVETDTPSGQATLRGSFNVRVPEGVDPAAFRGIVAWCDTYNVLFGWAPLDA